MRPLIATAIAATCFAGAHVAREAAKDAAAGTTAMAAEPYAPSVEAAPFISIGYRELAADLLFVRLVGYFGGPDNDASSIAALAEVIAALDPHYRRIYEWGAVAMTAARRGVDQSISLRAIELLETGARIYPDNWRYPNLAGQIYLVDLQTTDAAQRRAWDEQGSRLLEAASHRPDAPAEAAMTAAYLHTKLGQKQRAVDGLREMLLITNDHAARRRIIERLAELEHENSDEIAAEFYEGRRRFENQWKSERPAVNASMYLLVGPRLVPGFDVEALATGGIPTESTVPEHLEPLY